MGRTWLLYAYNYACVYTRYTQYYLNYHVILRARTLSFDWIIINNNNNNHRRLDYNNQPSVSVYLSGENTTKMLGYLTVVLLTVASQSLGLNCIHDFNDVEEAIVNGSLGVLSSLSSTFYPTIDRDTEFVTVRYSYAVNCSDEGRSPNSRINHTTEYVWAVSSVYLLVEPNALEDYTLGTVKTTKGNLFIDLQCFCSANEDDITFIISRLTAYVSYSAMCRCEYSNYSR